MTKIKEFTYQDGDFVVYPTHGVGKILGTEKSRIAGTEVQLMVIRFEQDRMTLRVPLEKARTLGLRTLSSRKHMDDAITILKSKAKIRRTICVKETLRLSSPIQKDKCINRHWNDWLVNLRQLRTSTKNQQLQNWKT